MVLRPGNGPAAAQPIGATVKQLPTIRFAWFDMLSAITTGERLAPLHSPTPPLLPVETAALNPAQTAIAARRNLVDRKWEQYDACSTAATAQDKRQVEPERSYPAFTLPPFPVASPCPLVGYTPPSRAKDQSLMALTLGGLIQRPPKAIKQDRTPGRGRTKWALLLRQLPAKDKAARRVDIGTYEWLDDSGYSPRLALRNMV